MNETTTAIENSAKGFPSSGSSRSSCAPNDVGARAMALLSILLMTCDWLCPMLAVPQTVPTELSGFTVDELGQIQDSAPWEMDDPIFKRFLHRVHQTSTRRLHDFATSQPDHSITDVVEKPESFRGRVVRRTGQAQAFMTLPLDDSDLSIPGIHLVWIQVESNINCLVVIPQPDADQSQAETPLPNRWPPKTQLNEPISFDGFFMSTRTLPDPLAGLLRLPARDPVDQGPLTFPVFFAKRLSWYPKAATPLFPVSDSELLLSHYGVDIARLDDVRRNISGTISQLETRSFYEMLAAVETMGQRLPSQSNIDFTDCLQQPRAHQGALLRVVGKVRRISKIEITDSWIRAFFPRSHYFQIDLIVPLENQQILIRSRDDNLPSGETPKPLVLDHRYLVICCVPDLPLGIEELQGRQISVAGFFYKLWNFESELSASDYQYPRQVSPLIIGRVHEVGSSGSGGLNLWLAVGAITLLLGGFLVYIFFRWDDGRRPSRRFRGNALPDKLEIT